LYARSGQRAAALRQYAECERVLGEELGVPPSPETVELYEAIRAGQDPFPDTPASGPVSPEPSSSHRHNLPAQLTSLVGREKELAELSDLLAPSAEARLVTVVGPGGMGKTRLTLEAASRQLDHYPDGVWLASLASVQSTEAIVPTVALALGVSFYAGATPREQLLDYLRGKRMLLVLDNLEHLLQGVDLLVQLLRNAPEVRILATSRARLNVTGERVFMLAGMDYPESSAQLSLPADLRRYSSVALFLHSARRICSTLELSKEELPHVARICQLAQGMPLAILLAAAWVPALTPAEIAAEMERSLDFLAADWRDEPERHHSMRAVFDATWGMLTEGEREAFARLSVFRGGFTREAAEAVAGADLRTLMSLVSKSLLQRDRSGRYEIHELLRQYGEGKLGEVPEEKEEALNRHSSYYIEFLAHNEADLWSGYLEESLHEIDNVGAAWRRATAQSRTRQIHRSMGGLFQLCQGPGLLHEGEAFYADAVKALRAQAMGPYGGDAQAVLGLALAMQAFFAAWYGYVDRADRLAREALSVLRGLGARREVALGSVLGVAATRDINPSEAQQILKESLSLSRKLSCYPAMLWALPMLAAYALVREVTEEAEQYASEALAVARRIDDRYDAAMALVLQGHIAYARAEFALARERYMESLALFQEARIEWAMGRLYSHLGDTAMVSGDLAAARTWHRRSLATYRQIGADWRSELPVIGGCWGVPVSMQRLGDVALAEGNGRQAKAHYRQALQRAMERPYTELCLHLMLGPAQLYIQRGNPERAAELAALARHYPASVEETRDRAGELLDRLRSELPPEAYAEAEARGQTLDLQATVRELLVEFEDT
jgi:predicted ATPase